MLNNRLILIRRERTSSWVVEAVLSRGRHPTSPRLGLPWLAQTLASPAIMRCGAVRGPAHRPSFSAAAARAPRAFRPGARTTRPGTRVRRPSGPRQAVGLSYLHHGPAILQRHGNALFILKGDTPNRLALRDELADELAGLEVPDLDTPIAAAADNPRVVELQACDAVVVRRKTMDGAEPLQRPDPYGPVAAASDQRVAAHL